MRSSTGIRSVALLLAALAGSALGGAETGDIDGDGRLTINDVRAAWQEEPAAEGSRDGFESYPCYYPSLVYGDILSEVLRRAVDDPYPAWSHFWPLSPRSTPLEEIEDVVVTVEKVSAPGRIDDRVVVELTLETRARIAGFLLILESVPRGLLWAVHREGMYFAWVQENWEHLSSSFSPSFGDINVRAALPYQLATGGRLVVGYNLMGERPVLDAGRHEIAFEARLPVGTVAGYYPLRVLAGSEVLLDDGRLGRPSVVDLPGAEVTVQSDVLDGWEGELPPIVIDAPARQVVGAVEFRASRVAGYPGDTVTVRVQMRTEVPLNHLKYKIQWAPGKFECLGRRSLFRNPETGQAYRPKDDILWCHDRGSMMPLGSHGGEYFLAGFETYSPVGDYSTNPGRLLEYFRPLGEWTDVSEVDLKIREDAAGGQDLALRFARFDWEGHRRGDGSSPFPVAEMAPFGTSYPNCGRENWPPDANWNYDLRYEDGLVRVLGDQEPPVGEGGVGMSLPEVRGRPGEEVVVPLMAWTERPLSTVHVALEVDEGVAVVEAIDMELLELRYGELIWERMERNTGLYYLDCIEEPEPMCWHAIPMFIRFLDSEERYTVVQLSINPPEGLFDEYLRPTPREILRLRLRIREEPTAPEAALRLGRAYFRMGGLEDVEAVCGGDLQIPENETFIVADEITHGRLVVEGFQPPFLRGDANLDSRVDLSDAVTTLTFLFLGGVVLECPDGADFDDSGDLVLTDAIYLLNHLFLGGPGLPEPSTGCGRDPSPDDLGCDRGCPVR